MTLRPFAFTVLATVLAIPACASSEAGGPGDENDVVTARCPTSLSLTLDHASVFKTVPKKRPDGTPLSATEQERTSVAMFDGTTLGTATMNLGTLVKTSRTCGYVGEGHSAVLRTKDGEDRLEISRDSLHIYLTPDSFDTSGIHFGAGAVANMYGRIFADDGSIIEVRIGKVRVSASTSPPPTPGATTLRVPLLDEDGKSLHAGDPSVPETMEIDDISGPDKFGVLMDDIEQKKGIDTTRFANPNAYATDDPATTICFNGPEVGVCDLLSRLTDSVLSDMFSLVEGDEGCVITKDSVTVTYFMSESNGTDEATIPRCK